MSQAADSQPVSLIFFQISQLVKNMIPNAWGKTRASCIPNRFQFAADFVLKSEFKLSLQQTKEHQHQPEYRQPGAERGGLPSKKDCRNYNDTFWCSFYCQPWYQRWCLLCFSLTGHMHNGLMTHGMRLLDSCSFNLCDYKFILCSSHSDVSMCRTFPGKTLIRLYNNF